MGQIVLLLLLITIGFIIHKNELKNYKTFGLYAFGFILLLSFISFVKHNVFDWLEWNGTDKNNWFYILWWGLVLLWAVFGVSSNKNK